MLRNVKRSVILINAVLLACIVLLATNAFAAQETWEDYSKRGIEFFEMRKYESAIEWFTKAIELNPENPDLYIWRGTSHALNTGDEPAGDGARVFKINLEENLAASHADFQKALSLDPNNEELKKKIDFFQAAGDKYIFAFQDVMIPDNEQDISKIQIINNDEFTKKIEEFMKEDEFFKKLMQEDENKKELPSYYDATPYEEPTEYSRRFEWFYDDGKLNGYVLYDSLDRPIYRETYGYYPPDLGDRALTSRTYYFYDSDSFPCTGMEVTYYDLHVEGEFIKKDNYNVYEYNDKGMMLRSAVLNNDGEVTFEKVYPVAQMFSNNS